VSDLNDLHQLDLFDSTTSLASIFIETTQMRKEDQSQINLRFISVDLVHPRQSLRLTTLLPRLDLLHRLALQTDKTLKTLPIRMLSLKHSTTRSKSNGLNDEAVILILFEDRRFPLLPLAKLPLTIDLVRTLSSRLDPTLTIPARRSSYDGRRRCNLSKSTRNPVLALDIAIEKDPVTSACLHFFTTFYIRMSTSSQ